jgi:hypothetical protein
MVMVACDSYSVSTLPPERASVNWQRGGGNVEIASLAGGAPYARRPRFRGPSGAAVGRACVLLLCGGDKRRQASDIKRALEYFRDYSEGTL